jgi:hypothetical protein
MEEEKSYVGMSDCFICGKPKEILLNKYLKDTLPRNAVYDKEPCNECKEWMKKGVIVIGVRDGEPQSDNPYRTGQFFVVKDDAIKRMPMDEKLKADILKKRIVFIEESVLRKFGFLDYIKPKVAE